ncbi:MAG: hypothetical protein RL186_528, partial [Pseudomonadota bacterium]
RGDLGAVVRAILLDPDAGSSLDPNFGKIREPIIRLANLFRACGATSASGKWQVRSTSSSLSLGQSPLTSPSVFNYFRPGYTPQGAKIGDLGLVAPEFQIVDEISVAAYANLIQSLLSTGIGYGSDVRLSLSSEIALARDPAALVDRLNTILLYGSMSAGLRQRTIDAVNDITIPTLPSATQAQIDTALKNRASIAVYFTMVSPDFLVQR